VQTPVRRLLQVFENPLHTPEPYLLNALFPPARGVKCVLRWEDVWKSDFGAAGSVGSC
jgi:hypothetical protein